MEQSRDGGLDSYLQAIGAHWLLVGVIALATVAGTTAAVSLRSPTYSATAKILVSPLPADDETFLGLQVIRDSGDPTRTVQTAAALIETQDAAELAAIRIGPGWSGRRVADATTVQADGQSNLLAIAAKASRPLLAARVADEYARAALFVRRQALRVRVVALITQLQARQRALSASDPGSEDIARRLNQLESVRDGEDPTLQLAGPAALPVTPSDPKWLLILVGTVVGICIGSSAALVRESLNQTRRARAA